MRIFAPLITLLVSASPLRAQSPAAPLGPPSVDSGVPVRFRHDTLFVLYGRLGSFSVQERAAAAEARILRAAPILARGSDSVVVASVDGRVELLVAEAVLMSVLEADATPLHSSRQAVAERYAARITEAVLANAHASSIQALSIDAGKALGATLVLLVLLGLLRRLFRRLYTFLESNKLPALRITGFTLLTAWQLSRSLMLVARSTRGALTFLLFYLYIPLVMSFFPWTAPYSGVIIGYVVDPLTSIWTGFVGYIPNIFFIAVIVAVTRYFLKLVGLIFRALGSGALEFDGFHKDWAAPTANIIRFLVIAFAAVILFPYLPGADSDAFKGISVFVGVLLSFGSSGAIGNIVAGVVLTYTQAFSVGDRVKIGETVGDVMERTMLVTRIRTIKNVEITIPNGAVLGGQIINYSRLARDPGLILHTTITIGYDVPWRQVHQLLLDAAAATEGVEKEPAPFVLQTSLDDSYVSYEINATITNASEMAQTHSALHQKIQDQFNGAGVEIMSPIYRAMRDGNPSTIPPAK